MHRGVAMGTRCSAVGSSLHRHQLLSWDWLRTDAQCVWDTVGHASHPDMVTMGNNRLIYCGMINRFEVLDLSWTIS